MKCPEDVKTYVKIRSDQKLFQFLNGLDQKFKPIKWEILDPLPIAEAAYATVRKETAHQNILGATNNEPQGIAIGLFGFVTKGYRRNDGKKKWVTRDDKSHLKYEEGGMSRHIKEQRFHIVGYPDWWTDGNKKGTKSAKTEKKKFLPPILAPLTKKTQVMVGDQMDIRTGRIIGRGTEREGLYYVDEVTTSETVMLAHGTSEREAWFTPMKKYGYKQSNSDLTLFLRHEGDRVTCLIIYVADMIISENDESEIKKLKEGLCVEFKIKDLRNLRYFLGIDVMRSPQGIFICQKKYIPDLLAETGMIDCKPADTPMITNQKLFIKTKAKLANKDRYQRMVGKLIYLSHTRPDIAYAVGVVSQHMHQPQVDHMHAVLRIVRYLKRTTSHGVLLKTNGHLYIQIFTDADWARDKGNRTSTFGYFSLVGGNLVTWKSKKKKVVSLSSVEAEFRGIAKGLTEALWIRKLVSDRVPSKREYSEYE
nr:putative reverse transcriptase, RNA-dependent DNA polymerase [Tanacetum cinerariifolium]